MSALEAGPSITATLEPASIVARLDSHDMRPLSLLRRQAWPTIAYNVPSFLPACLQLTHLQLDALSGFFGQQGVHGKAAASHSSWIFPCACSPAQLRVTLGRTWGSCSCGDEQTHPQT